MILKKSTDSLTNPDTSTGLRVTSVIMAEAKRVQEGREREAKEKEKKKEEETSKKVDRLLDRKIAFDKLLEICSEFSDVSTAFNAKTTKGDLLLKSYQYLGGAMKGLKNKKKETIVQALLTEFSNKFAESTNNTNI